jgi:heptosyltransferase III
MLKDGLLASVMLKEKRGAKLPRMVDRYIGIPVVFLRGLFRNRRRQPEAVQRIGLISLGTIGDALLVSALAADLKNRYPDARITMIISNANRAITPLLPHVDSFVVLTLSHPLSAVRMLRAEKFDLLIDFLQWPRISAIYASLAGARFTTGFRTPGQHRHFAYDQVVDHSSSRHELDNFRMLVRALGIAVDGKPRVEVAPDDIETIRESLREPYVVFHPWASGFKGFLREWPVERYIGLAKGLAWHGYRVVVTGGPGDAEKTAALVRAARQEGVEIESMAGRLDLTRTAALLAGSRLVVAVSTGILHLAAALDVPLVALYGPTNPQRWGPLSSNAIVIVPEGVESGYLHLGFEYPEHPVDCMRFISVDSVLDAALLALRRSGERQFADKPPRNAVECRA